MIVLLVPFPVVQDVGSHCFLLLGLFLIAWSFLRDRSWWIIRFFGLLGKVSSCSSFDVCLLCL